MHISDMLGQYNRNISSGTEELKAASGMQKVVSTLEELSSGSVFDGNRQFCEERKSDSGT